MEILTSVKYGSFSKLKSRRCQNKNLLKTLKHIILISENRILVCRISWSWALTTTKNTSGSTVPCAREMFARRSATLSTFHITSRNARISCIQLTGWV